MKSGILIILSGIVVLVLLSQDRFRKQHELSQDQSEYRLRGGNHLVGNVTPLGDCPLIGMNRFGMEVIYSSAECGSSVRVYRILSDDRLTARVLMQALDNAHYPSDLQTRNVKYTECEWRSWGVIYPLTDKHIDDTMGCILCRPILVDIHLSRDHGIYRVDARQAFYREPSRRENGWRWGEHVPTEELTGHWDFHLIRQVDFLPSYLPKIPLCEDWPNG